MNPRFCCLFILFLSAVPLLAADDCIEPIPGGWTCRDPNDPHVIQIGKFAVTEHNRRTKSHLKFERVEKAWSQVVAGINYRLILVVKDGPSTKKYEAVVWEKAWENFRNLTSFKPVVG